MRMKFVPSVLALATFLLTLATGPVLAVTCGDAYFNHDINWPQTSPLYFSVAGAPASTYGNLYARRNSLGGYTMEAAGWILTDGSGNATKGPWYHYNQADDETADAYIDWGTCTSPVARHIWDVDPPLVDINSGGPSNFNGDAADDAWGAGFNDDWAYCYAEYYDATTGKWFDLYGYNATEETFIICSLSGMPSLIASWSTTTAQRPEVGDHVSGHQYYWRIRVWDGGQWSNEAESGFIY